MEIFLSTPSARRATCPHPRCQAAADDFYPRPPRGGRLIYCKRLNPDTCISIHALREEGNQHGAAVGVKYYVFLSTPSARRATRRPSLPPGRLSDFYPRPPRGGRQLCPALFPDVMGISIHALREEGDSGWKPRPPLRCNFYPRPPRGGRPPAGVLARWSIRFLSTPSERRAT